MKKLLLPLAALLLGAFSFSSCGSDDKEDDPLAYQLPRASYYDIYPNDVSGTKRQVVSPVIPLYFYGWSEAEDYRFTLDFPTDHTKYKRVILQYKMGGMNQGPHAWDYTMMIFVKHKTTGERFEILRGITPYGGSFDAGWSKTFYVDVTEYLPLLEGETEFSIYFGGDWVGPTPGERRHTVTLTFDMYEGTPERETVYMAKVYDSSRDGNSGYRAFSYGVAGHSIEAPGRMGNKSFNIPANVHELEMKISITGHGAEQGQFVERPGYSTRNAAEFDKNTFTVKVNGVVSQKEGTIFKTCAANYPQAGTYQYDRANWCPGNPIMTQYWRFGNAYAGRQFTVDIDLEEYISVHTDPNADGVAQYIVEVDLFGFRKN